jgi:hypothetical protein
MTLYQKNKYILANANYFAQWVEAKTLKTNKTLIIAKFIYEFILTYGFTFVYHGHCLPLFIYQFPNEAYQFHHLLPTRK